MLFEHLQAVAEKAKSDPVERTTDEPVASPAKAVDRTAQRETERSAAPASGVQAKSQHVARDRQADTANAQTYDAWNQCLLLFSVELDRAGAELTRLMDPTDPRGLQPEDLERITSFVEAQSPLDGILTDITTRGVEAMLLNQGLQVLTGAMLRYKKRLGAAKSQLGMDVSERIEAKYEALARAAGFDPKELQPQHFAGPARKAIRTSVTKDLVEAALENVEHLQLLREAPAEVKPRWLRTLSVLNQLLEAIDNEKPAGIDKKSLFKPLDTAIAQLDQLAIPGVDAKVLQQLVKEAKGKL